MNKYKNLVSNTIIFTIGTFSAKVLSYILRFVLTDYIDPAANSEVSNVLKICNLILPVVYLYVSEAIIRYGLDRAYKKTDVFTTAALTVMGGYLVFLIVLPLAGKIAGVSSYIEGYENLMRFFVLASASHTAVTHYVRASGLVRVFALEGMFTCVTMVLFNYLFVVVLGQGGPGHMLATICSDGLSTLILLVGLRLYRFWKIRGINWRTSDEMLRYSIPLVPTAIFWWVTNVSDSFFVTELCGPELNGVYDISTTIPSMIMIVSSIFIQAWQISAFTEYRGSAGRRFYSTVFRSYYSIVFLAASALILLIRPLTRFYNADYGEAWRFSLFLLLAQAFSCLVTFLGTIYNAVKKNAMVTVTTAIGAGLNILMNWLMIPKMGPLGAALATFLSYLAVFIIRAVDTQKYIRIDMQPLRVAASLAILVGQVVISLLEPKLWILWDILLFIALLVCNLGYIWFMVKRALEVVTPILARGK